jgi:hypothetical protein
MALGALYGLIPGMPRRSVVAAEAALPGTPETA